MNRRGGAADPLTRAQRRELVVIGRQVAAEDSVPATALSLPPTPASSAVVETFGWGVFSAGTLLLMSGLVLSAHPVVAVALLLMAAFRLPLRASRLERT